jgi:hypothetical protein
VEKKYRWLPSTVSARHRLHWFSAPFGQTAQYTIFLPDIEAGKRWQMREGVVKQVLFLSTSFIGSIPKIFLQFSDHLSCGHVRLCYATSLIYVGSF